MGVDGLAATGLHHVEPHLLDGPVQRLAEQMGTEFGQMRRQARAQVGQQWISVRRQDLRMRQLAGVVVELPRSGRKALPERAQAAVVEQPRHAQDRGRKKLEQVAHRVTSCQ